MSVIAIDPNDPKKSPGYIEISNFLDYSFKAAIMSGESTLQETPVDLRKYKDTLDDFNDGTIDQAGLYDAEVGTIPNALGQTSVMTTAEHVKDYAFIEKILFDDLGLQRSKMEQLDYKPGMPLLPGDVLLLEIPENISKSRSTLSFYSVVISYGRTLYTFPELSHGKNLIYTRVVFRPTDIIGNTELLTKLNYGIQEFHEKTEGIERINIGTDIDEPEGLLQIGDIKFLVSPTQISFVTQNGYQQFPTIRTRGDPKIPTMQEVKSLHINLIFPNEDNVNNQLLPLFAMYRRAPFVNLYNKDICGFFSELRGPASKFIPIALDSINIESVQGFPNTLQATLNILPFQHKGVGSSFKALNTFVDVRAQQWFQNDKSDAIITDALEKRLYNKRTTKRLPHLIKPTINATYDFEESEPFRAFYQSLIAERNHVEDYRGNTVYKSKVGRGTKGGTISLETFRPTREENKLHYYVTDHNINRAIKFSYTYVPDDVRKFSAKRADARDKELFRLAKSTNEMMQILNKTDSPEFQNLLKNAFVNRQTFYDQAKSRLQDAGDILNKYFAIHNIDINQGPGKQITSLLELLMATAKGKAATVTAAANAIKAFTSGEVTVRSQDEDLLGILRNITVYAEGRGSVTPEGLSNLVGERIQAYFADIGTEKGKTQWADFFKTYFEALDGKLINTKLSNLKVSSIPIEEDELIIDNVNDVIEGWSAIFANKFVPVNLEGFKYPFYQHIGSDDVSLSLSIKSIQAGRTRGFKEQLSELNDRLQRSAKVVMYSAPELILELDPRLKIGVEKDVHGSIFDMLNIKSAVFNGSNVTNIPNQPDCWKINVNLTQANFTVRDYQSIQSIPNFDPIKDEITNLLSRCSVDTQGNIQVWNYVINLTQLKNRKQNEGQVTVDPQEDLYWEENTDELSIIGDPTKSKAYGGSVKTPVSGSQLRKLNTNIHNFAFYYTQYENIVAAATGEDIAKGSETFDLVSRSIIDRIPSTEETKRLKKVITGDPQLARLVKNLIHRINQLHLHHASILANFFKDDDRSFFQRVDNRTNAYTVGTLLAGGFLLAAAIASTGGIALVVGLFGTSLIGASVSDVIVGAISEPIIQRGKKSLASKYQSTIEGIINGIKYAHIDKIANDIIRDPLVRKQLFDNKYEDLVQGAYLNKGVNCYNDFDLPLGYRMEQSRYHKVGAGEQDGLLGLMFSPDFYLYNHDISQLEKESYANSSIEQLKNIAKTASMLTLKENYETLEMIAQLDKTIFPKQDQDKVRERLLEDLQLGQSSDAASDLDVASRLGKLRRLYAKIATNNKIATDAENPDQRKFNLIRSAQSRRIVQLKVLQTAVNLSIEGFGETEKNTTIVTLLPKVLSKLSAEALGKLTGLSATDDIIKGSLLDSSKDSVDKMSRDIGEFFEIYLNEGTGTVNTPVRRQQLISKPGSRKFEESVYILINQLILLGTALRDYEQGEREFDYLSEIPEVKMLDWFNWRLEEDADTNRIDMLQQYLSQDKINSRGSNAKLFPTFKLFFVEEDGRTIKNMDDYYSYNAIQSIDIVSNKESASKTAIIRLSNSMGHLTDKMSLMKETNSVFDRVTSNQDNLFLGTLDIKPGTKIIIKMGYHANDSFLSTVFVGRIIEMNPGPDMTMVCQSYGAQLNHHITKMNFGLLSSVNEHGDIAATVLDAVPGLDGFGKPSLLNLHAERFTGQNLRQIDKNLFEKFMVSNLLNRVNSGMFTQDNPRDANIFLPFSLFPTALEKMTFDWRVYDQSVWEVLHELSLYHRNTRPIVKLYNNDIYSTMDDLRESIVVGDKSGYYKFTDSFALSSLRVSDIEALVEDWNTKTRDLVINIIQTIPPDTDNLSAGPVAIVTPKQIEEVLPALTDAGYLIADDTNKRIRYYPTPLFIKVLKFFRSRLNVTALVKRILQNSDGIVPSTIMGYSMTSILNMFPGIANTPNEKLIRRLMALSSLGDMTDRQYELLEIGRKDKEGFKLLGHRANINSRVLEFLMFLKNGQYDSYFQPPIGMLAELNPDDLLTVDELIIDNKASHLVNNPQYKKIQKHHLITDMSDIISNNIMLSEDFKNAVSVYYLPEPKFYSGLSGMNHGDVTKLRSWTIKSFGDLRDSDTRLLESYQKNVDTNWWDIRSDTDEVLRSYAKKRMEDFTEGQDNPVWDKLPTFVITAISLLQKEVEKMYQGTIQIVGNPAIEPYDIIHINDILNDMHGPIEVAEVIHSFTPDKGFTTTITPSLITYDRDPVGLSDVETIGRMLDVADMKVNRARMHAAIMGTIALPFAVGGLGTLFNSSSSIVAKGLGGLTGGVGGMGVLGAIWDGTIGIEKRYTKFIYDSLANVFGRDCINFSALFYHGVPFMCGFDGVDYTSLTTLINHQWQGLSTIQRLATAKDVEYKWLLNTGELGDQDITGAFIGDIFGHNKPLWDVLFGSSFGKDK